MKPTVQAPDFYMIGNDYVQAPLSSFYDVDTVWDKQSLCEAAGVDVSEWSAYSGVLGTKLNEPKFYQDGIYTKLATKLAGEGDESKTAYFKNPEGFNKRRVYEDANSKLLNVGETYGKDGENVKTTDDKEQPTYDSKQYGAADIVFPEQYVEGDDSSPSTDADGDDSKD